MLFYTITRNHKKCFFSPASNAQSMWIRLISWFVWRLNQINHQTLDTQRIFRASYGSHVFIWHVRCWNRFLNIHACRFNEIPHGQAEWRQKMCDHLLLNGKYTPHHRHFIAHHFKILMPKNSKTETFTGNSLVYFCNFFFFLSFWPTIDCSTI